jgi:hypothetical protein
MAHEVSLISYSIKDINIKIRRALIEFLVKENFKPNGFKEIEMKLSNENRITITDGKGIIISFDIGYASDYREDAYKWCFVDFFIDKHGIDLDDELKTKFTRYIDSISKRMYWRHREMIRIIEMDRAVEYILNIKNELENILKEYDVI